MRQGYIYKLTNRHTGLSYIGQTVRPVSQRWNAHVSASLRHRTSYPLNKAILLFGPDTFQVETLATVPTDELDALETHYIALLRSTDPQYGYNVLSGGSGYTHEKTDILSRGRKGKAPWNKGLKGAQEAWNKGLFFSEESRLKMRDAKLNDPISIARLRTLAAARVGRPSPQRGVKRTPEQKERIRIGKLNATAGQPSPKKGTRLTEEQKAKANATRARNKAAKEAAQQALQTPHLEEAAACIGQ